MGPPSCRRRTNGQWEGTKKRTKIRPNSPKFARQTTANDAEQWEDSLRLSGKTAVGRQQWEDSLRLSGKTSHCSASFAVVGLANLGDFGRIGADWAEIVRFRRVNDRAPANEAAHDVVGRRPYGTP